MSTVSRLLDSLGFFIENQNNSSSVLTVTASGTGTYTGSDIINTVHRGGKFFVGFTTVNTTCTLRLTLQSKDPLTGFYVNGVTASFDALATAASNTAVAFHVYPGLLAASASTEINANESFCRINRIIASITATASGGGAAVSFTTGLSKIW